MWHWIHPHHCVYVGKDSFGKPCVVESNLVELARTGVLTTVRYCTNMKNAYTLWKKTIGR